VADNVGEVYPVPEREVEVEVLFLQVRPEELVAERVGEM
jgi:hypothetical protein